MSEGTIRQFIDYTSASDDNQNDAESIEPVLNGENVIAGVGGVVNRPAENLRERSEVIRGVLEDLRYLADADRQLMLGGPGLVTWPGPPAWVGGTGIPTISDNLWIVPALTPGEAGNTPPVASAYGTLQLDSIEVPDGGILCTSMRRSYSGGDQISVKVIADAAFSVELLADKRTIIVTAIAGTTTLLEVKDAINALVDSEGQFVAATYYGAGADAHVIVAPQTKQFVAGNYDGEAHLITKANFDAFFAVGAGANALSDGDSLCIWFEYLIDPGTPATKGGRRQSIPENTNTTVLEGAFFNSRLHPERLVNALPVAKVLNNNLIWLNGVAIPPGAVDYSPVSETAWGPGPAWFDATTNPATTVGLQVSKIITDLGTAAGTGAAKIGAPIVAGAPHAWAAALGVDTALADLLGWQNAHYAGSADKHDADKIVAPTAAGSPYAWAAPGDVAARLAALLGLTNTQADQFGDYARSGVLTLDYGSSPSALNWDVVGGIYWLNGERITYTGGSVTLTDATVNYVYMDTDKVLKTTTTLATAFEPPRLPLAKVTTAGGVVTASVDLRRFITRQNGKDLVTVGGENNYDFASLDAAVEWARATRTASTGERFPCVIEVRGDVVVDATIDIDFPIHIRGGAVSSGSFPGIKPPVGSTAFNLQSGSQDSRFTGLRVSMDVTTAGSGFLETVATSILNVEIDNCTFVGGNGTPIIELNSGGVRQFQIHHNQFRGGVGAGSCVGGVGGNASIHDNLLVSDDTDDWIHIGGAVGGSICNNDIRGGKNSVSLTSEATVVKGNKCESPRGFCIKLTGAKCAVTDNYITDAQAAGSDGVIHVTGADAFVEGNYLNGWLYGNGIYASGVRAFISANKLYAAADDSSLPPGIQLADTALDSVVQNNYVDMSPGAGGGAGLGDTTGIDAGADGSGCMVTGNTVLNCGQAANLGVGIIAGTSATVANNNVYNIQGNAYRFHGEVLIITGNRGKLTGGADVYLFDKNTAGDGPEACIVTGNYAWSPAGFQPFAFAGGTSPANNRFWNNFSVEGLDWGTEGYASAKNFSKSIDPAEMVNLPNGYAMVAQYKPENGYVGLMLASWTLPPKVGDVTPKITLSYSDGTVSAAFSNATGLAVTTDRGDVELKDGVGVVGVEFGVSNSGATQTVDIGEFHVEGDQA